MLLVLILMLIFLLCKLDIFKFLDRPKLSIPPNVDKKWLKDLMDRWNDHEPKTHKLLIDLINEIICAVIN